MADGEEIRAAAWEEYLKACREAAEFGDYETLEAWAWARLQQQIEQAAPVKG